jgi:hypothetical protein
MQFAAAEYVKCIQIILILLIGIPHILIMCEKKQRVCKMHTDYTDPN